jgi:hypothetical protein
MTTRLLRHIRDADPARRVRVVAAVPVTAMTVFVFLFHRPLPSLVTLTETL